MAQQTALDFYIDKINEWFEDACVHCELCKEDNEIYQQAKQMEKEQIMQSYNDGKSSVIHIEENKSLEQYYNETYGDQTNN